MKRAVLVGLCLVLVGSPLRAQSAEQKKATVAYLRRLQTREGGFRATADSDQPSLRASTAALRALKYCGGAPRDRAACANFVRRCFHKERGGFSDRPGGQPDVITTAIGLMALVELKIPLEGYEDPAVRYLGEKARGFEEVRMAAAGLEAVTSRPPQARQWLEDLKKMRNPDGTFGKGDGLARDTGGAVVAVLRLGGGVREKDAVLAKLNAGQRKDGSFGKAGTAGSDLETTYRVLRAFVMLQARPTRAEACREFVARCRNPDGGYGVAPGQKSSVSGTYFAAIVLHWLK